MGKRYILYSFNVEEALFCALFFFEIKNALLHGMTWRD